MNHGTSDDDVAEPAAYSASPSLVRPLFHHRSHCSQKYSGHIPDALAWRGSHCLFHGTFPPGAS